MKSIIISVLLVFLISCSCFGQRCNCNLELNYVKEKIEKNYPGFKDKVNTKTEEVYYKHTALALAKSKLINRPAYCVSLINEWLEFFKDGHLQVGRNRVSDVEEEVWLHNRIQEIEHVDLSAEQLTALKGSKGITGVYYDENSTTKIAVIYNKNTFRDYAGVVISSETGRWLPGQVILELKHGKDTLKGIQYDKYYIPENVSLRIGRDALGTFRREEKKRLYPEPVPDAAVSSKVLSAKTLYMKISTFNQRNARNIDSLIKANQSNLSEMPNLILDLRNNGGGADFSYRPIIPYLYTSTFRNIGADVFSTDDNIAGWAAVATTPGLPPDQKVFISDVIQKLEQHKGKLVSISADENITLDSVSHHPQKIIILINKNCGSTTEEFLLLAKQSSKVILMGEHTAGVLDYANIRGADFSCMPYMLYWATSRSRRIDQGLSIDNIGIKPDKTLNAKQNWIEEAKRYAEELIP